MRDPARVRAEQRYRERHRDEINARRRARTAEQVAKVQLRRPRCLVCDGPLPYGKRGFNRSMRTCSAKCSHKAWRWFGPVRPRKKVTK